MITLNNTNDNETLGERKLTKKQIAPINHCIFLVAYYGAIKNKTNFVEIKGESKKHSISPNVNKLNSIEACNENKVESLSGSTFIEGKNNITHNTFNITQNADVMTNAAKNVKALSSTQTNHKQTGTVKPSYSETLIAGISTNENRFSLIDLVDEKSNNKNTSIKQKSKSKSTTNKKRFINHEMNTFDYQDYKIPSMADSLEKQRNLTGCLNCNKLTKYELCLECAGQDIKNTDKYLVLSEHSDSDLDLNSQLSLAGASLFNYKRDMQRLNKKQNQELKFTKPLVAKRTKGENSEVNRFCKDTKETDVSRQVIYVVSKTNADNYSGITINNTNSDLNSNALINEKRIDSETNVFLESFPYRKPSKTNNSDKKEVNLDKNDQVNKKSLKVIYDKQGHKQLTNEQYYYDLVTEHISLNRKLTLKNKELEKTIKLMSEKKESEIVKNIENPDITTNDAIIAPIQNNHITNPIKINELQTNINSDLDKEIKLQSLKILAGILGLNS